MNMLKKTATFLSLALLASALNAQPIQLPNADPVATGLPATIQCIWPTGNGQVPSANIYSQLNSFFSPQVAVNPTNANNIVVLQQSDAYFDQSCPPTFTPVFFGSFLTSLSLDGGTTWSLSFPQQSYCVGDDSFLAQLAFPLAYPLSFSPDGTLYVAGVSSQTQVTNPLSYIFLQSSNDGGVTWSPATLVDGSIGGTTSLAYLNCSSTQTGCANTCFLDSPSGGVLADPFNQGYVHVTWSRVFFPSTLYGNLWYARSDDYGQSIAVGPNLIYDISNDLSSLIEVNSNFGGAGSCFYGEAIGGNIVSGGSSGILYNIFLREYPRVNTLQTPSVPVTPENWDDTANTTYADHAILVSTNDGESWSVFSYLPLYTFAETHDPRTSGAAPVFVADGSLNIPFVYNPATGNFYAAYQAGNEEVSTDPLVNQFFPSIQLAYSTNGGGSWNTLTASQTPCNGSINPAICQSFNPNMILLGNGQLGVIYSDFRYYNPIINPFYNPNFVNTDTWLAIFNDTVNGPEFVREIRITSESFNAAVGFPTFEGATTALSTLGSAALKGIGSTSGLAANGANSTLVAYGVTNQSTPLLVTSPAPPPNLGTIDTNNRLNVWFNNVTT